MLSRVADSIFWMCRYIERAENIARFIIVNWHLELDTTVPQATQWAPLVAVTADEEAFERRYDSYKRDNVIQFLAFDREYDNSIITCLERARENARSIREIISSEMWESVNTFYLSVQEAAAAGPHLASPYDYFNSIVRASAEFVGFTMTTLTRDESWHFCRAGRMLERADKTSRVLDVKYFYLLPSVTDVGTPVDQIQWGALLRSTSALQSYRQLYGPIVPRNVVELLLLSRYFPRSVRYCCERVQDSLHSMTGATVGTYSDQAERRAGQVLSELAYAQVDDVISHGLHEFIDRTQTQLNAVGIAIQDTYFVARHVPGAVKAPEGSSQSQAQS